MNMYSRAARIRDWWSKDREDVRHQAEEFNLTGVGMEEADEATMSKGFFKWQQGQILQCI